MNQIITSIITQSKTEHTKLYKSAIAYAKLLKWSVFPLHPQGKAPIYKGGFHVATTDMGQIHQWWTSHPNANVGVPTGQVNGFFVLDVDPRDGGDDSLQQLIDKYGELPDTVEAITGSGGRHLLFRCSDQKVRINAGLIGDGLDIRGNGGHIVVAPSLHKCGKEYTWELSSHPKDKNIADAPGWLLHLVTKRKGKVGGGKVSSNYWYKVMQGVSEPGRNEIAAEILGHLLRRYVDPYMAWLIMKQWNEKNGPPLTQVELHKVFNSIYSTEIERRESGSRYE